MSNIPVIKVSAVITGSRGIAYATARKLLEDRVVNDIVFLSRTEPSGRESVLTLVNEVEPGIGRITAQHISCDLHGGQALESVCKQLESWPNSIKVLVNAAGTAGVDQLLISNNFQDSTSLQSVFKTNVFGPMQLTKSVAKKMLRGKGDRSIINVSSVVGSHGNVGQTVYGASKAALNGFTKSLARELGGRSIRVNAVEPGFIRTNMTKHLDEIETLRKIGGSSLNRFGTAEEVAAVISFLASEKSTFVTGQIWRVDGGM
jgi:3-oxoacyl-[acyl-carrier protein] reductase